MYTVHGMASSGNCYKVKLALEQLGLPYRWIEIDTRGGKTQTPEFLAINPAGQVPLLEIQPGNYLPESNAILYFLAEDTPLWPTNRLARAQVLQWMFFEQYSHEPYIAVARFINKMLPADHARRADLPRLRERGYQALNIMEGHLKGRRFFVEDTYTIADIALYAYTHAAADGGFDLMRYPAINAWLGKVESQPGYISIG